MSYAMESTLSGGAITANPLTLTGFTQGSVLFVGASSVVTQDNANFFWDDTNNKLGLGTTSPATYLHIKGTNVASRGQLTLEGATPQFSLYTDATTPKFRVFVSGARTQFQLDTASDYFQFSGTGGNFMAVGATGIPSQLLTVGGTTSQFQVNTTGNIVKLNGVTTTFPASQGASGSLYRNSDGAGTITWGNITIGDTIASATLGSVLYAGSSGVLTQDNARFFWDSTNFRLGLNTTTPNGKIQSVSDNTSAPGFVNTVYNNTGAALFPVFVGQYSKGTLASPSAVQSGDVLLNVSAQGYNSSTFTSGGRANIKLITTENWSTTANGSAITFLTTPNTTAVAAEALRVDNTGFIGVGTTSPTSMLSVGASSQFQVDSNGNIVKLNNVVTTFPSSQGATGAVLTNSDGAGTLTWSTSLTPKRGASSGTVKVGGATYQNTATTGNTAATETDAFSHTVTASTLGTDGDSLEFYAAGTFANTASTDKQVKVKFGSTTIFDTGALAITSASNWALYGSVIRTGAATQKAFVTFDTSSASLSAYASYSTATETLSGAITMKLTLKGTNANDAVAEMYKEYWESAS